LIHFSYDHNNDTQVEGAWSTDKGFVGSFVRECSLAEVFRKLGQFFREVWRRRVFQVAIPYGVGAWLLVQIAEIVLDAFETPAWVMQGLLTLLVLGFPVAVILAWVFDITPKGSVVRTGPMPEQAEEDPEPAPAVSLEMGDSERRQVTVLSCAYEFAESREFEIDPEYLQDSHAALEAISSRLAERFNAYQLPSGAEELTLAFGYPQAHGGDGRRAVAAGLALIRDVENSPELQSDAGVSAFTARVGVATGLVVVDESNPADRNVTIVGQVLRRANWLESLAAPGTLLIGPQTRKLVESRFQLEAAGSHAQPQTGGEITVYRVHAPLAPTDFFAGDLLLTGRDDEMSLLEDRWEDTLEGEGQFVVLRGKAGIGKSSLVNAFYKRVAESAENVIIPCQCSPYERHNPLAPLIQLIQGPVLQFSDQDSSEVRLQKLVEFMERQPMDTAETIPLLANLLSLDAGTQFAPPSSSAQVVRLQTLALLLDMICQAAEKSPVLMIMEDLHWADPTTLEWVQMMIDRGAVPGLFALFSARPHFKADWTKRSYVLTHGLLPLGRRDARNLVHSTEGADELPESIVDRIVSETDGNPLYIQELTRAVLESDAWRTSLEKGTPDAMTWLEIPATLQDSLAARVDNLGEAKGLLQLCSVLGREFSYDLLKLVSGTENEAALKEELSRIVKAELLFQRGIFRNLTYTFKHILIQETAYNSLLKSKRRELHRRTARVLEQETPDVAKRQPALLAHHYGEAGDLEKAVAYWTIASQKSLTRFANEEAMAQSRRGIEMLKAVPKSPHSAALEVPLQSALGYALLASNGYAHPDVRKAFTRALELCEQIGDAPQLFKIAVGLWMYYIIASRMDEALDLGQRLLRIAESTQHPVQHMQAHYCLAFTQYYRANLLASKLMMETALEGEVEGCDYSSMSPIGDDWRIHVRVILAHVYWHLGQVKAGEKLVREANAIAKERKHPWGIVFAAFQSAWFHQMQGQPEATLKYSAEVIRIAEEKGFGFWLPLTNFLSGWAESRRSNSCMAPKDSSGTEKMKASLDQYRAIGSGAGASCCLFMLAEDYIWLGRYDEAAVELENARTFLRETGENFFEPEYHRLHGRIHLDRYRDSGQTEELDEAAIHFKQALALARRIESRALELRTAPFRAEALSLQGNHELAVRMLTGITQRAVEFSGSHDWAQATKMLAGLENRTG
jgi:class 3 adenylate cyclase/tetratricopeptide (TPR) repeat protein